MKTIKNIILLIAIVLSAGSCKKTFEDLQINPNQPSNVPPSLLFQGILNDMFEGSWVDNSVMRYNQFYLCNYNYYGDNEYNWTSGNFEYASLNNVVLMEKEAERLMGKEDNPYLALGKFFRAFFAVRMSLKFGDIPMSEAVQGIDNTTPAYDTQKQVFVNALNLLDEANDLMKNAIEKGEKTIEGDIYFNNDLAKWHKAINTYKLRVLIHLSKYASDNDLKVKERFAAVLSNPARYPLMVGLSDNMAYTYNSSTNPYPLNPGNKGFHAGRYNHSSTFLGTLVNLRDPRTFVVADPAPARLAQGFTPADFEAYVGAPAGEALDEMAFKMGNGEYSPINQRRYYSSFSGPEPTIQIGYPELCFNIAEAANRGWVNANAQEWYVKGITATMEFYGITDIAAYLAQPAVAYAGDNTNGLNQILTQKYLAFFQNSGWEAFFNQRRTGVPVFDVGPGTGNGSRIPKRYQYPVSERTTNTANYNTAVSRQFGTDDINALMWIIKQ